MKVLAADAFASMPLESQLVKKWFDEVWGQNSEDAIRQMFAPDGVVHGLGGQAIQGAEGFLGFARPFWQTFGGFETVFHQIMQSGPTVAYYATCLVE